MSLLHLLGAVTEIDEESQPAVIEEARKALLGGVRHSSSEWVAMSQAERDAYAKAGASILSEGALQLAMAITKPEHQRNLADAAYGKDVVQSMRKMNALEKLREAVNSA